MELVHYDVAGGRATVTLDSPANRNALSLQLVTELAGHLRSAYDDPAVRVVVLAATGTVFCSGADLSERRGPQDSSGSEGVVAVMQSLFFGPKPVVCAVNGAARAGGLGILAACDVVVAVPEATFSFTEVRLGLAPAMISVPVLRRMPAAAARELFLTGETFDAARAVAVGLVNAVGGEEEVTRYVDMLALGGPEALADTKTVLARVPDLPQEQGVREMLDVSLRRFASEEAREGMAARKEKRPARWVPTGAPAD